MKIFLLLVQGKTIQQLILSMQKLYSCLHKWSCFYRDLITSPSPAKIFIAPNSPTLATEEDIYHCNDTSQNRTDRNNVCHLECPRHTIYFKDDKRSVDFVLVWDSFQEEAVTELAYKRRKVFEENLMKEGLNLEYEQPESNGLNFIKVISFVFVLKYVFLHVFHAKHLS